MLACNLDRAEMLAANCLVHCSHTVPSWQLAKDCSRCGLDDKPLTSSVVEKAIGAAIQNAIHRPTYDTIKARRESRVTGH